MLAVMIKASGEDPKDDVLHRIMFPIIDSWITVFKKTGFILECHGQNTLVERGRDGNPSRIVYRDLDNTYDPAFRESKGLDNSGLHPGSAIESPSDEYPEGS